MTSLCAEGFDRIAPEYDRLWTGTPAGRLQREAVWRHTAGLFPADSHLLDLGCGTGDDALMFAARGVHVTAIDASPDMVRLARSRGVNARYCSIENVEETGDKFDGVFSNFGALNCVERLADLREPLARMVRPGGWLALCLMSRVYIWETLWYALHGQPRKAVRRWSGEATSNVVSRVFYPTANALRETFAPDFTLTASYGIGITVPPSFVTGLPENVVTRLAAIDRRIASWPLLRSLGDHRLFIFRRGESR